MKSKLNPIAEIDCDTGKWRVVWQWTRGGLIQGKFFDGTDAGFEEALKFARTISKNPPVFSEVPAAVGEKYSRLNRERAKGYSGAS